MLAFQKRVQISGWKNQRALSERGALKLLFQHCVSSQKARVHTLSCIDTHLLNKLHIKTVGFKHCTFIGTERKIILEKHCVAGVG